MGWYEGGKKKAKALPSKALARHFCQIKYTQLNSDVFTGTVNAGWHQLVEEYRQAKQVEGLRAASIYEAMLTFGHFERLVGSDSSKRINQNTLDKFILDRGSEVKKTTLNKDIRNLNTFLHWAARNRFIASGLEVKKVKVAQKPVMALTAQQVQALLSTAARYGLTAWSYIRTSSIRPDQKLPGARAAPVQIWLRTLSCRGCYWILHDAGAVGFYDRTSGSREIVQLLRWVISR